MGLPVHIAEAIDEHLGKNPLPYEGFWADDEECQGALFHSPRPLTLVKVWITPEEMAGADDALDYVVMVCPTSAANLLVLRSLLLATDGQLPWVVRREFGNSLRALALRGWQRWMKDRADA